jgi:hypothetical protein
MHNCSGLHVINQEAVNGFFPIELYFSWQMLCSWFFDEELLSV